MTGLRRLRSSVLHLLFVLLPSASDAFVRPFHYDSSPRSSAATTTARPSASSDQALEALQSLTEFHKGTWKGVARSFAVTADVAAGIVQRKTSPSYTVSVQLSAANDVAKRDFTLTETMEWQDTSNDDDRTLKVPSSSSSSSSSLSRKLSLGQSTMDVDAVDASYSLDSSLPDFPSAISGTDKLKQFMIEHCIAVNHDQRARCLAFYGVDQSLIRVVVCQEERVRDDDPTAGTTIMTRTASAGEQQTATWSAQDLVEMQSDVDRLVGKITDRLEKNGSSNSGDHGKAAEHANAAGQSRPDDHVLDKKSSKDVSASASENALKPHIMSLLEMSSGIWLGDCIIRDVPMVPMSPLEKKSKGFGTVSSSSTTKPERLPFASWSVGVQKVAWRWMWNFGDEIRLVNDFGKAMGAELAEALTKDLSGSVCVNQGLSRRIPPEERMVYVDWNDNNVGFMIGSYSIQLPRYLNFDPTRRIRPFYTEFCVYQEAEGMSAQKLLRSSNAEFSEDSELALPDIVCSKIARIYNYEGRLRQGCTSFFTLKRFGREVESDR